MNVHCGKHDKIYDDVSGSCPGCDTEKLEQPESEESEEEETAIKGPDDSIAELRTKKKRK
jgi:hypothetical protein